MKGSYLNNPGRGGEEPDYDGPWSEGSRDIAREQRRDAEPDDEDLDGWLEEDFDLRQGEGLDLLDDEQPGDWWPEDEGGDY